VVTRNAHKYNRDIRKPLLLERPALPWILALSNELSPTWAAFLEARLPAQYPSIGIRYRDTPVSCLLSPVLGHRHGRRSVDLGVARPRAGAGRSTATFLPLGCVNSILSDEITPSPRRGRRSPPRRWPTDHRSVARRGPSTTDEARRRRTRLGRAYLLRLPPLSAVDSRRTPITRLAGWRKRGRPNSSDWAGASFGLRSVAGSHVATAAWGR